MKEQLKETLLTHAKQLQDQGFDLSLDCAEMTFVYPDYPELLITITLGGMFAGMSPPDGEVH